MSWHRSGYQMCLYCDCITTGPAVLIYVDALRNNESNKMRSFPFYCWTATPFSIVYYFRLSYANRMLYHATFISQRQEYMLENVHKYAHLLTEVVRDDKIDDAWFFMFVTWDWRKYVRGIDNARHSLSVKAKHDLDVLPPAHGALELHITRANYQAKIWLQADHVKMDLEIH